MYLQVYKKHTDTPVKWNLWTKIWDPYKSDNMLNKDEKLKWDWH